MRSRPLCKTAVTGLVWVLLTTPATMLPLLFFLDRAGSPLKRLEPTLRPWGMATIVAFALIGLPLIGACIGGVALKRTRSSWTPVRGGGFARAAVFLGVLAALAGGILFVIGISQ